MAMLCFVLDLRSLSSPLLRELKQLLLQLANFYAISSPISERPHSNPLRDRISGSSEDAADKCVLVGFVLLEQNSSHLGDLPENINNFVKQICDLENCSFRTFLPDAKLLCSLVKRWLQELKDDMEEQLQAHFIFKRDLVGYLKQISCNLCSSYNHMIDGFTPCQTCRCHGMPVDDEQGNKIKRSSCPLTGKDLGTWNP